MTTIFSVRPHRVLPSRNSIGRDPKTQKRLFYIRKAREVLYPPLGPFFYAHRSVHVVHLDASAQRLKFMMGRVIVEHVTNSASQRDNL